MTVEGIRIEENTNIALLLSNYILASLSFNDRPVIGKMHAFTLRGLYK